MYHIDDSRYTKKSSVLYEGGSRILFGESGIGSGNSFYIYIYYDLLDYYACGYLYNCIHNLSLEGAMKASWKDRGEDR